MSKKKNILIFAHYYYPDVASTGQILQDLAEGIRKEFNVTVICTVPSYEGTVAEEYKHRKGCFVENINGVRVIRVPVCEFTKSNKLSRVRNILSYFFGAISVCRKCGRQDYIFTISQPPVMGGLLGVIGKYLKRAKFIYNIQDYNPEQIIAVGYFKFKPLLKLMLMLDKFSCRQSDLVITVGRDLVDTLNNRFHGKNVPKCVMINNWIDERSIYPLPKDNEGVKQFRQKCELTDKFVIMYSGNIGLYYDLQNLIKVIGEFDGAKTPDGREVVFVFVGAGSLLGDLTNYIIKNKLTNVKFIPYQDKDKLIYSLNAADVHWCVNAEGIKGVSCPSKFYGIAACAKPVLGVLEKDTEIRSIMEETGCGKVCEPGDYKGVSDNIRWFIDHAASETELVNMGQRGYEYLIKNMTKDISIDKYIEAIKNI
ncbi:MAG: glycosyltransferase family 4 protein [Lachnospiraceae bacterium]|nr:glycosyltransferase family 4 protein [Lachnospiraceae bacterium]